MAQSSELAGGAGFTFEGDVAAFYMAALLTEGYAPGIERRVVRKVSVQQRDFDAPLDDVIVDFAEANGVGAQLSLQVKRSLTISAAKSNEDFRDVVRDSWATLNTSKFRVGIDRYGVAVGEVTSVARERDFRMLCEWARESITPEHFEQRFSSTGNASESVKQIHHVVSTVLEDFCAEPITASVIHRLLSHFVLVRFEFLSEGATSPTDAINNIADCLHSEEREKAPLIWARLVELAREAAGAAGQYDRPRLVRAISPLTKLAGAKSFQSDLRKLKELAASYLLLIPDDVGGTRLSRSSLQRSLDESMGARLLEVRGLPGSGKSVLLRRTVQRHLDSGPVLFLKAEQLEGTNWLSFAATHGLSSTSLLELLVEIGATGTPTLFLDAIDRIPTKQQPIVLDILNTIREYPALLGDWRVIASLRDTSVELLRNWLEPYITYLGVQTLQVTPLDDIEAELLATEKPYLRPLLFGPEKVKEIVRRPFFAKILNQSFQVSDGESDFVPQSEIDLIENWWRRGGYDADQQDVIERQRLLIDLAKTRARNLSQPIANKNLTHIGRLSELINDGIIQHNRFGISVQFSHDIFFEWAFFYVLAEQEDSWMDEIKNCGEPPGVARVVELSSQWEFTRGSKWERYLVTAEMPGVRSQWLRAWLLGPLGNSSFDGNSKQFESVVFGNDFRLLEKALVWFQAEKTVPNSGILAQHLSTEERLRIADALGLPSDYETWIRLLVFLIKRAPLISKRLYPNMVAVFEVWQNSFAHLSNPVSSTFLTLCTQWWRQLAKLGRYAEKKEDGGWKDLPDIRSFRVSIRNLLLRSALSEPKLVTDFLHQAAATNLADEIFDGVILYSIILSKACPTELVNFTLKRLKEELPQVKYDREAAAERANLERRIKIREKPESQRTERENSVLANWLPITNRNRYDLFDWRELAIADDHQKYSPPSPLREPFNALFLQAPQEALRLLRELCNHAMLAWRQIHVLSARAGGDALQVSSVVPWGEKVFGGCSNVYIWFRSMGSPQAIGSGFMALEDWCFSELDRGADVDKLIQTIASGNECVAILGVAAALALHTDTVSEASFALVTSLRLLTADEFRFTQDFQSSANLMGFAGKQAKPHVDAIQRANMRPIRKKHLSWLVPNFMFAPDLYPDRIQQSIRNFPNVLQFEYAEQSMTPEAQSQRLSKAAEYADLVDPHTYHAYQSPDAPEKIEVVHVSSKATAPENVAKRAEAVKYLRESALQSWASKTFENGVVDRLFKLDEAVVIAKAINDEIFTEATIDSLDQTTGSALRGSLAATAAVALAFRDGVPEETLEWAREVLWKANEFPIDGDLSTVSTAIVPWHYAIYVSRGLAADYSYGTAKADAPIALLSLITHPLEMVSIAALKEVLDRWEQAPRLAWSAIYLALSMCKVARGENRNLHPTMLHELEVMHAKLDEAIRVHDRDDWSPLPAPPSPWAKLDPDSDNSDVPRYIVNDEETGEDIHWGHPNEFWHSSLAAKYMEIFPYQELLKSGAWNAILGFLAACQDWTLEKMSPPWESSSDRRKSNPEIREWVRGFGRVLGDVAGYVPLAEARKKFILPILELEDGKCWALLEPLADRLVRKHVYDAAVLTDDVLSLLNDCLDRFLKATEFNEASYRRGILHGFEQPALLRTLSFVSIERAAMAARFVNGDWSEIRRITPLVDRLIRNAGWSATVMTEFLTLCERAKENYPAGEFADQVLAILIGKRHKLVGWRETFINARLAGLVQHFSSMNAPMEAILAQKFLEILDVLVDMGDRRSAALQLSEAFREIRLPPHK